MVEYISNIIAVTGRDCSTIAATFTDADDKEITEGNFYFVIPSLELRIKGKYKVNQWEFEIPVLPFGELKYYFEFEGEQVSFSSRLLIKE